MACLLYGCSHGAWISHAGQWSTGNSNNCNAFDARFGHCFEFDSHCYHYHSIRLPIWCVRSMLHAFSIWKVRWIELRLILHLFFKVLENLTCNASNYLDRLRTWNSNSTCLIHSRVATMHTFLGSLRCCCYVFGPPSLNCRMMYSSRLTLSNLIGFVCSFVEMCGYSISHWV